MQNISFNHFLQTLDEISDLEKNRIKSVSNEEELRLITSKLEETFKSKVAPIVGNLEMNLTRELEKAKMM